MALKFVLAALARVWAAISSSASKLGTCTGADQARLASITVAVCNLQIATPLRSGVMAKDNEVAIDVASLKGAFRHRPN